MYILLLNYTWATQYLMVDIITRCDSSWLCITLRISIFSHRCNKILLVISLYRKRVRLPVLHICVHDQLASLLWGVDNAAYHYRVHGGDKTQHYGLGMERESEMSQLSFPGRGIWPATRTYLSRVPIILIISPWKPKPNLQAFGKGTLWFILHQLETWVTVS